MMVIVPPLVAPGTSGAGPSESSGSVAIDTGLVRGLVAALVSVAPLVGVLTAGAQRRDEHEDPDSGESSSEVAW